jgi:hypothetical protein
MLKESLAQNRMNPGLFGGFCDGRGKWKGRIEPFRALDVVFDVFKDRGKLGRVACVH